MKKILTTILVFNFLFIEKTFAQQEESVVSLKNINGNPLYDPAKNDGNLGLIFNNIFYLVLAAAVILAIFGIIRAGYLFMASGDNASKRGEAKGRIVASVGGLVLALGAVLILQTINTDLTKINIVFPAIREVELPEIDIPLDTNNDGMISSEEYSQWMNRDEFFSPFSTTSTEAGQKILEAAKYAADNELDTCSANGTEGGKLACAYAVNLIVQKALGTNIANTLSTAKMDEALKSSGRFEYVGNNLSSALPGDIIMSPTNGRKGHVGISETNGATSIISNSSSDRSVQRHFTADRWRELYSTDRGLDINIYRAK